MHASTNFELETPGGLADRAQSRSDAAESICTDYMVLEPHIRMLDEAVKWLHERRRT